MSAPGVELVERTWLRRVERLAGRWIQRKSRTTATGGGPRIGVGLVGVGNVARWLYLPQLQRPDCPFRLMAVYDVDQEAARRAAQPFGAKVCGSILELLKSEGLEAVCVCSPVRFHREAVMAALAAKRHVLCEKPLGYTLAESAAMQASAVESGCVHMVNFSYRFRPDVALVARVVREGVLGRVYHAWGTISQGLWFTPEGLPSQERVDAAAWKFGAEGGVVMDLGPHLVDFCRWCFGEVREVQAWTRRLRSGDAACEDACGVSFTFEQDTTVQMLTSRWATGHRERAWLEISGSEGALIWENGVIKVWTNSVPRWRTLMVPPPVPGAFLRSFAERIRGGGGGIPDFKDGLRNSEVLDAVFRSAQDGRPVRLRAEDPAGSKPDRSSIAAVPGVSL